MMNFDERTDLERKLQASVTALEAKPLARIPASQLATVATQELRFTPDQEQMIRDTFANGASPSEFQVLMEVAKARRLNPLLRQIHFVSRWNNDKKRHVWSTQVSIDGLRAIAERTRLYDGQDEPEFTYGSDKFPAIAKVRVYRKDWSRPVVGVAYYAEYVQTTRDGNPTQFWREKPHIMLAKCAEALAMRKAFPEDTSGLYIPEEMGEMAATEQQQRAPQKRPIIDPHLTEGDDPDRAPDATGTELFEQLYAELNDIEAAIASARNYDECVAIRANLGSKAKGSDLTRRLGEASGKLNPMGVPPAITRDQTKELAKTWQRCDRQLQKKEKELGDVTASFADPEDDGR